MSGKACSSSTSVVQAQKLIHQLRIEAGMERLKVREICPSLSQRFGPTGITFISFCLKSVDLSDSCRPGPVLSGTQAQ